MPNAGNQMVLTGTPGAFNRAVVVSGPPPTHPHGPIIRGNFVPRFVTAPGSVTGCGASGSGGVYAIVKPQNNAAATNAGAVVRGIGGGPPVHICVPGGVAVASGSKLGPAPGNFWSSYSCR